MLPLFINWRSKRRFYFKVWIVTKLHLKHWLFHSVRLWFTPNVSIMDSLVYYGNGCTHQSTLQYRLTVSLARLLQLFLVSSEHYSTPWFTRVLRLRLNGSCITIFTQIITVTSLSKSMRAMKCTRYILAQHRYHVRAIPKRQCAPFPNISLSRW